MKNITDLAKIIRSKNSSPFKLTLDIIFKNSADYAKIKAMQGINRELIASLYQIKESEISSIVWFDPANAVKINLSRNISSGAPGDSDVYGAQQHAPLLNIEFDL